MHKLTIQQLKKCNTKLPDWDENTKSLVLKHEKQSTPMIDTSSEKPIRIQNYIINEPSNFTLSSNWNGGTKPPEQDMVVTVIEQMGKMYKVRGIGITTNIQWEGWLPEKGFNFL